MKKAYPIYLTKEELEAIPVILQMAEIYSWDLYNKKEEDRYYQQHKENMDLIIEYHNKGYQGVLAVGSFIESKSKLVLKDIELDEVLTPYMNKQIKEEAILYCSADVSIKNHIGKFEDNYIDFITIIYDNDKKYDVVPIENKFSIPYIENGIVKVFYKKKFKNVVCYTSSNR